MIFIFHCKGDSWPAHRRMDVWDEAGKFIKMKSGSPHQRSGSHSSFVYGVIYLYYAHCVYKVTDQLKRKFESQAKLQYGFGGNQHHRLTFHCFIIQEMLLHLLVTISSGVQTDSHSSVENS